MSELTDNTAVVIDNGSGTIKVGISGDDTPRAAFPSVVGKPKIKGIFVGMDQKEYYVGLEAIQKSKDLDLSYPIQGGLIQDWEGIEKIWHHCYFNELRVPPEDYPVFMTEPPLNPRANREKMIKRMFEIFQVDSFYVCTQAVLALYASGRTTGLVLDSGEGATSSVPIYEGYALPHAIMKIDLAGKDLTKYLLSLLKRSGVNFSMYSDRELEIAKDIKERCCRVAEDFDAAMKDTPESQGKEIPYELPDKSIIKIGLPQYQCPEALFQPSKLERETVGIHELIFQSIMKCDMDVRRDFYRNIVLAGGTTMFRDISDRLTKNIGNLAPSTMPVKIDPPAERKFSVWIGASILSSLRSFESLWISKQDYQEVGDHIVHRRCF
eukprot:TRINITY_DN7349_c0_g2_i6.p1 TRINITY_DN7349_c0_g2~~TRINITY_DN7349_c0_g2_i6.p1  ORF type:complete len:380 (-),score=85.75 TRINITY_DN7349_c0_g2_i6:346-1485(-)